MYNNFWKKSNPPEAHSRDNLRQQLLSLILYRGLPAWRVTINVDDQSNIAIQLFGGEKIDIDQMFPTDATMLDSNQRREYVANDPCAAAQLFDAHTTTIMQALFKVDNEKQNEISILGGKIDLHLHLNLWVIA